MSFLDRFRKSKPEPIPVPPSLYNTAVEQAVVRTVEEVTRRLMPNSPLPIAPIGNIKGAPYPLYAWDNPWQYYTPQAPTRRPGSSVDMRTLRIIADSYDILRSCINHIKREVAAVPISIVTKEDSDQSESTKLRIKEATDWFDTGGGLGGKGYRRSQFESVLIEDLCVIGAGAVYYHPTRKGNPYEAVNIDSSTIRPRVDNYGWPGPGEDVWEQWVLGIHVASFTREEMRYDGVFPVSHSPYFKSPIEWLISTINGALQADQWNLSWLTDGTTPSDAYAMPADWTPDQIKDFWNFFNATNAGNTKSRVKAKMFPSGTQKVNEGTRKEHDFQEFMLWLMRRTCSIMGVSPASIGFAGEQYKVSQEGSMDGTSAFGVGIVLEYRDATYNDMLSRLGYDELLCTSVTAKEDSAKDRASTNQTLVGAPVKSINEARADEGLDPIEGGDQVLVPGTLVPLENLLKQSDAAVKIAENVANNPQGAEDGGMLEEGGENSEEGNADNSELAPGAYSEDEVPDQRVAVGNLTRDIQTWKRKCLSRIKDGKSPACTFVSSSIPSWFQLSFVGIETREDVERLFGEVITNPFLTRAAGKIAAGTGKAKINTHGNDGAAGHWVHIDDENIFIKDGQLTPEHIDKAADKHGMPKQHVNNLKESHADGDLKTVKQLYHYLALQKGYEKKGSSSGVAHLLSLQHIVDHGSIESIKAAIKDGKLGHSSVDVALKHVWTGKNKKEVAKQKEESQTEHKEEKVPEVESDSNQFGEWKQYNESYFLNKDGVEIASVYQDLLGNWIGKVSATQAKTLPQSDPDDAKAATIKLVEKHNKLVADTPDGWKYVGYGNVVAYKLTKYSYESAQVWFDYFSSQWLTEYGSKSVGNFDTLKEAVAAVDLASADKGSTFDKWRKTENDALQSRISEHFDKVGNFADVELDGGQDGMKHLQTAPDGSEWDTNSHTIRAFAKQTIQIELGQRLLANDDVVDNLAPYLKERFSLSGSEYFNSDTIAEAIKKRDSSMVFDHTKDSKQIMAEFAAATFVQQWANSSSDSQTHSIAVQFAVHFELGLDEEVLDNYKERAFTPNGAEFYFKHKKVMRGIAREMYSHTQSRLKAEGLKNIQLYRAVAWSDTYNAPDDIRDQMLDNPDTIRMDSNPITSWAANSQEAHAHEGESGPTIVKSASIPAERIFSTARTGNGCLNENEFVVIGSPSDRYNIDSSDGWGTPDDDGKSWSGIHYGTGYKSKSYPTHFEAIADMEEHIKNDKA